MPELLSTFALSACFSCSPSSTPTSCSSNQPMKKAILEIIDYLRYQVDNDKCTAEELRSIYELTSESLKVSATIDDLAEFYGQS